jgi:hypothetical protein
MRSAALVGSNSKLVVINNHRNRRVSQLLLAEILELDRQIASLLHERSVKCEAVSAALRHGAAIEEGPHRAWFTKLKIC